MEENKELEVVNDEKATEANAPEETTEVVAEATEEKVEEAPVEEAPAEEAPVEEASVEEATVEEVPAEEASVEEASVEEAPTEEATVEEAPAEETSNEETSEEETPAEETSEDETSEEKPEKKAKKKLDSTNIIVIVVCAVVVIACVVFFGFRLGWFNFLKTGEITLPDYNNIEVAKQAVETSDELVNSYIDELLELQSTTQQVKEGVVEDGDTVNIDYAGKLAETGVAFDGGTGQGYDLVIGSGTFIDTFEEQLIGQAIGSSVVVNVTFPENYDTAELAGKPAVFDVTINYKSVKVKPELTDEWVKENGSKFLEGKFSTADEFKAAMKDFVYKIQLHSAMFEDIQSKQEIKSYNEKSKKELLEFLSSKIAEEAAYYGYDEDSLAKMYGAESAQAYAEAQAEQYLALMMPIEEIFKKEHLKVTDEQVNAYLQRYIYQQGIGDTYTVDQVKEAQGEYWVKLYTTLEVKYDIAMTALEKYVKFVDAADEGESQSAN